MNKSEKESNIGVKSNKTNGDYHDGADAGYDYGYYEEFDTGKEEYGDDYATSYYDDYQNSNSAIKRLGMFRSSHKGNHLPSIESVFLVMISNRLHFPEYFLKEFQGLDVTDEQIKEKEKMFSPEIKSFSFKLS